MIFKSFNAFVSFSESSKKAFRAEITFALKAFFELSENDANALND